MITAAYDSNYEASVNALIRHAADYADKRRERDRIYCKDIRTLADPTKAWTEYFHYAMNNYAAAKGLRPNWNIHKIDKAGKVVPRESG